MGDSSNCWLVSALVEDGTVLTVLVLMHSFALAFFLLLTVIFLVALWQSHNIHCNCRLLLASIALGYDLLFVGEFLKTLAIRSDLSGQLRENLCASDPTAAHLSSSEASAAHLSWNCCWLELPSAVGHTLMAIALPCLAFERFVATIRCSTYEKSFSARFYGIAILCFQVLICAARIPFVGWSSSCAGDGASCVRLLIHGDSFGRNLFHLCLQTIAFVVLIALNRYNRHIMQAFREAAVPSAVSTRYQINENLKITKFLITLSIVQIFATLYATYDSWAFQYSTSKMDWNEATYTRDRMCFALFLLVIPAACVVLDAILAQHTIRVNALKFLRLRQTALTRCCAGPTARRYRISDQTTVTNGAQQSYFEALEKQWQSRCRT